MTAGRKSVTSTKDWGTPKKYVDAIKKFFDGEISLDPCSNKFSIVNALTEYSLPTHDGLLKSWDFPTIYVNPPYGLDRDHGTKINDWLKRCENANRLYKSEVLALVPVATNTGHWKRYVFGKATAICFLYDTRLKFLVNGKDEGTGAPMSCAMIYWGMQLNKFSQVFMQFGAVVDVQNLKGMTIGHQSDTDSQLLPTHYNG